MIENLIKEHISKLTKEDINKFALDNNIKLTDNELNSIYEITKNDWYELIYGDSSIIFSNHRSKIKEENYLKIEELFYFFKKKYQRFL